MHYICGTFTSMHILIYAYMYITYKLHTYMYVYVYGTCIIKMKLLQFFLGTCSIVLLYCIYHGNKKVLHVRENFVPYMYYSLFKRKIYMHVQQCVHHTATFSCTTLHVLHADAYHSERIL